jgi:hypothetical protein
MKIIRWWILTILAAPALATESPPEISAARILAHTKMLASDEFEGRAPASAGEEKTVHYLVSELKKSACSRVIRTALIFSRCR